MVEKFEEQQAYKDMEFERVKEQIQDKFAENEATIEDLRAQLQDSKDFTYQE